MKSMVDDTKIEAALSALAGMPDTGRVEVTDLGFAMRDTGLTVAELRDILEAARGQAWRDASDPPSDSRWVWGQTHDGRELKARRILGGTWINIPAEPISVRRWRELPR